MAKWSSKCARVASPILALLFVAACGSGGGSSEANRPSASGSGPPTTPPPPSAPASPAVITGVTFNAASHLRAAPGSDNWPATWSNDDQQYAIWGDGGGFGGTETEGRASLGVARIEGDGRNYQGVN